MSKETKSNDVKESAVPKPPTGWQDGCELIELHQAIDYLFRNDKLIRHAELMVAGWGSTPERELLVPIKTVLSHYTRHRQDNKKNVVWIRCEGPIQAMSGQNWTPNYYARASIDGRRHKFWVDKIMPQNKEYIKKSKIITEKKLIVALEALNDTLYNLLKLPAWYRVSTIQGHPITNESRIVPAFATMEHLGYYVVDLRNAAYSMIGIFLMPAALESDTKLLSRKKGSNEEKLKEEDFEYIRIFLPWNEVKDIYDNGILRNRSSSKSANAETIQNFKTVIKRLIKEPDIRLKTISGTTWRGETLRTRASEINIIGRVIDPEWDDDSIIQYLRSNNKNVAAALTHCIPELKRLALQQQM
ncbi:MAG: hypothetical protein GY847_00895 [Proteobacteria bacterium]|nr:hypothetical protein [Pseudomonadota bacterium]